jgi:23S rRNA pseudouridine2605 synthase
MDENKSIAGDRLNKYLALQLGLSRREADDYISAQRVRVNNTPAVLGARVRSGDIVTVDGKAVQGGVEFAYLALNKPVGYLSSRRSQGDTPTLYTLLPSEYHALKPVGRLDKDSSGLLLLTNDGNFAYRMTHPKFYKIKIYTVELDADLAPLHQQMISDYGVQLEDGTSKFELERLSDSHRKGWTITMSEGRNRQIRRTFAALGYTVTKLHRTHFGDYSLGDMSPGDYKVITIS